MKYALILTLIFASASVTINAQDFETDPSNGTQTLEVGGNILYMLQHINQSGLSQYAQIKVNSEDGPIATLGMNTSESGELELFNLNSLSRRVTFNETGLKFIENDANVYSITKQAGFQAYDNNGNMTVQIRGDVGGDGRVSTNELEITGGSDFSENFDIESHSTSTIEPGMLVSITGEEGKLALSSSKRDKRVVGIISGANGIETGMIMGQKGSIADGDYPIALSGRTYVYANTENGAIEPGDFITTSSTPGYGMKVKKHKKAQGAIVGKAMTSLESGSGYVLVLVNLQ